MEVCIRDKLGVVLLLVVYCVMCKLNPGKEYSLKWLERELPLQTGRRVKNWRGFKMVARENCLKLYRQNNLQNIQ